MLIVSAMRYCFTMGHKEIDVKYWMNAPLRGKFQPTIDRGHHLNDLKRSVALCCKFGCRLGGAEIFAF